MGFDVADTSRALQTRMAIDSSGGLTVTGDITAFGSISDERLKTGVRPMDHEAAADTIMQLRPVQFQWKHDIFNAGRAGTADEGLIAQEVAQVYPYVTDTVRHLDGNTYNVVRYEKLTPLLLSGVQGLVNSRQDLESRTQRLEQDKQALQVTVDQLGQDKQALEARVSRLEQALSKLLPSC
jgi:hypothetical protein